MCSCTRPRRGGRLTMEKEGGFLSGRVGVRDEHGDDDYSERDV